MLNNRRYKQAFDFVKSKESIYVSLIQKFNQNMNTLASFKVR